MMSEKRPVLIVVAGPNGSGKTTLTERLLKNEWLADCVYINPDNVARDRFGDWNSAESVLKAAQYSETERDRCLAERRSIAFETVLSAPDKIEYIRRAKEAGFFVRLFFVGTDNPDINAKRIAMRVEAGGHAVPIDKIISRYGKSIANCAKAAAIADRAYVYDNSIEDGEPLLMFRCVDSLVMNRHSAVNPWAGRVADALSSSHVPKPTGIR